MCSSHLRLGRGPRSRRFVSSSALRRRLRSRSDRQTGCVLSARGAGERASRQGLPPPHETRSRPRLASASARRFRSKPTSCVCCRVSPLTKPVGHDYRRPRSRESSRRSLLVVAPRTQHALTPRPRLSFACGRLRARSAFLGTITIVAAPWAPAPRCSSPIPL